MRNLLTAAIALSLFLPLSAEADTQAMSQEQLALYRIEQARLSDVADKRREGKTAEAVELLEEYTKQGSGEAPYVLGTMYLKGDGVKVDKKKALSLFYTSAKNGNNNGSYALGQAYLEGDGIPQNYNKAHKWMDASNLSCAQYLAGTMYLEGVGVEKDFDKAWLSFKNAALQNDVRSMATLGEMCLLGLGMQKSGLQAKRWLDPAAKAGDAKALFYMSQLYATGNGVEKNPDLAAEFLKKYQAAKAKLAKPVSKEQQITLKEIDDLQSRMERLARSVTLMNQTTAAPTATTGTFAH